IGSPKMNFLPVKVTATAIDQVQVELRTTDTKAFVIISDRSANAVAVLTLEEGTSVATKDADKSVFNGTVIGLRGRCNGAKPCTEAAAATLMR
ncbi:hypothetical protein O5817_27515, partial [Escherichia coli]|nr:hypothetical protein [Escherichia coli]